MALHTNQHYYQYQTTQSLAVQPISYVIPSGFEQDFAFNQNDYENDNTIDEIINVNFFQPLLNNYYDESKRKDSHIRAKSKANFKLFCLPHGDLTPKIPRIVAKLHASLKKSICFDDDDLDNGIKKAIEELFPCLKNRKWRFFRCKSTSNLEIAPEPINGWSISELKRIAGSRKKLYLGTIDGPIQLITQTQLQFYKAIH